MRGRRALLLGLLAAASLDARPWEYLLLRAAPAAVSHEA